MILNIGLFGRYFRKKVLKNTALKNKPKPYIT